MGGAPVPQVVEFRGIYTDDDTAQLLVELARISGPIYVDPLGGCGSYQGQAVRTPDGRIITLGSTKASAETHTGPGAVDLNAEHLTDVEARALETLARSLGCAAWFRPAVSPYTQQPYGWQRHLHLIRTDAPGLPDAARRQVTAYRNKLDGLAVPHADRGSHAYLTASWAAYREELDMPLTDDDVQRIARAVWTTAWTSPSNDKPYPASSYLINANVWAGQARNAVQQLAKAEANRYTVGTAREKLAADRYASVMAAVTGKPEPAAGDLAAELAQLLAPNLRDALAESLPDLALDAAAADRVAAAVLARMGAALVDDDEPEAPAPAA